MTENNDKLKAEIEEFNRIQKLFSPPIMDKPKEFEIEKCIDTLNKRLKERKLLLPVRAGYTNAAQVLKDRIMTYDKFDFESIETDQSRAIVMLAIDFLNGKCSKKVLCSIEKPKRDKR